MMATHQRSEFDHSIIASDDRVLVTGAAGFIGARVVETLLQYGASRVRCLVRPSSDGGKLARILKDPVHSARVEVVHGNLLSPADCQKAAAGVAVIYHLAAGTGSKSFPDAFLNSVVTTRNLLDAALQHGCLRRFVNLSSFAVYSNHGNDRPGILDESSPVEPHPQSRAEAYCYAKVKQDALVVEYGKKHHLPFVLVRPGVVYGPGKYSITGRVGVDSFGIFLHTGGSNRIPFTYVDNCAEAIVLAGFRRGIEGEVFNVVDDDLPTSRQFLRAYKRQVRSFRSIYLPKFASYLFCLLWEKCAVWLDHQLPAVFTRREWRASWQRTAYPNRKLKQRLGWTPRVATEEGMQRYFASCREALNHA
jgi:nucleoside-diphosphate-sugar epimerase